MDAINWSHLIQKGKRIFQGLLKKPPAAFSLLEGLNVHSVRLALLAACGLAGRLFSTVPVPVLYSGIWQDQPAFEEYLNYSTGLLRFLIREFKRATSVWKER